MKPLEDILPHVLPFAAGCPEPIALRAIRKAAIQFCERTKLWRTTDKYYAEPQCDIALPPYASLVAIEDARFDGRRLEPISFGDLNARYPSQDWRDLDEGDPRYVTQTSLNSVRVVPQTQGMVSLSIVLAPSQSAKELPDFLVDQFPYVIAYGALGDILLIRGEPWSDPQMAVAYATQFTNETDRLFSKSITGQQGAPIRTRPKYF